MKYATTYFIIIIFNIVFAESISKISGKVVAGNGDNLAYVNVYFIDSLEGAMTNEYGQFLINTTKYGDRILYFTHIGYEEQSIEINVNSEPQVLSITLIRSFVEIDPISVSTSSFTMADKDGQTLSSMEVVTTAGASADIFRAIQTFPGVNQVDEGAGMYVRGGDVLETTVILDQATIAHPYKYESDTGGYFGMINPWLLSGTYFSTGGFSAKYGNILSGVLAMESQDLPEQSSITIGVGLAAVSSGGAWLVKPGKLGVQFSGNYSDTKYLFKLNGGEDRFEQVPVSWDGNISIVWKYSTLGQIKLFTFSNVDEIAVYVTSPDYTTIMINNNNSQLSNLQWKQLFPNDLLIKSSISTNQFSKKLFLGALVKDETDYVLKWRTDITKQIGKKLVFNTGLIIDNLDTEINARFPIDANDLSPSAETDTLNVDYNTCHLGVYVETEYKWLSRFMVVAGLRGDILEFPYQKVLDPRFSINYRLSDRQFIKLATGIYHQYPKAQYRDKLAGNPNLKSMQATHYIAGYEYKHENTDFKTEVYYKDYQKLLLEISDANYTNGGYGYAYGADVFIKGTLPFISGWFSYSYLQSNRKELSYSELVPTDYDINHNLTSVLKTQFGINNNISLTYRYSTGKPYTQALNQWNSVRLPSIHRLDLSFSKIYSIRRDGVLVLYASISNLLDNTNIYGYIYSPDYSERTELKSTHGRNLYFGFSLTL
jgi:vitamin B12 transporter